MRKVSKIISRISHIRYRHFVPKSIGKPREHSSGVISRPLNMTLGIPTPAIVDLLDPAFRNTIVLFGNSITEWSFDDDTKGYGYQLGQYYMGKVQVLNRGVAGLVNLCSHCL